MFYVTFSFSTTTTRNTHICTFKIMIPIYDSYIILTRSWTTKYIFFIFFVFLFLLTYYKQIFTKTIKMRLLRCVFLIDGDYLHFYFITTS